MPQVSTRLRGPDDEEFLCALYASTRPELAVLGWPEMALSAFIRMQFSAQDRYYSQSFPAARYGVVCVNGEPAGRLIVNRSQTEIAIVDIALLPAVRHQGVGRALVAGILGEADADGLRVRLHALRGSAACRFWERAGFVARGGDGPYLAMERACATWPS
jgi:GNAT superfamily N-acetyltransferase